MIDAEGNVSAEFVHETSGCRFRVEVRAQDVR